MADIRWLRPFEEADLIKIVGHRGARGCFPENSCWFIETINMGRTLEFDVVSTSDGVPVIHMITTCTPQHFAALIVLS